MSQAISNLATLIASMQPHLHDGAYAYCTLEQGRSFSHLNPVVTVIEQEGTTLVLRETEALIHGLPILFRCAWITLTVHSNLEAVGLTAAFARALGQAGISCNVVAGAYHDHIFVPFEKADAAVFALLALQQEAHHSNNT